MSAASQVHGTVVIAVLVGFVLLAVFARLAISGGGPYPATVDDVVTSGTGLAVTLTVTNEGEGEGQTTCRLQDPSQLASGSSAFVLSPRIAAGVDDDVHDRSSGVRADAPRAARHVPDAVTHARSTTTSRSAWPSPPGPARSSWTATSGSSASTTRAPATS